MRPRIWMFALGTGSASLSMAFVATAFNLVKSSLLHVRFDLLQPTLESRLFFAGYSLWMAGSFLAYFAWSHRLNSQTARVRRPRFLIVGLVLLFLATGSLLNYSSELDIRSAFASQPVLTAGLFMGSLGHMLLIMGAGGKQPKIVFRWLVIPAVIVLILSRAAYLGEIHFSVYYASGLQKPLAIVSALLSASIMIGFLATHVRANAFDYFRRMRERASRMRC